MAIPARALVLLIGPAACGKSTFARKHFRATEILSSDFCRGLVCDDESHQGATRDAFQVLHLVVAKRLARGRLTVVDATNVQRRARKPLLELAMRYRRQAVAIVFNLPAEICLQWDRMRRERKVGSAAILAQHEHLQRAMFTLAEEGFRQVHAFSSPREIDLANIVRV